MTENAIEVSGLIKRFGGSTAVAGLDFRVGVGECVGLLGPNGAGKTTTVEILEGLQTASEGEVRLFGQRWQDRPELLRSMIGVQLQETHLYERLTVTETLRLFRTFYDRGAGVEEAIELVGLGEKRDAWLMHLSGGQRQRVAVAAALMGDPLLVFLDEPSTGLDPPARREIWSIVETLKSQGRTVFLTTHYMEEAERLCDRVIIVDHGRIVAEGTPAQLVQRTGGGHLVVLRTTPALEPGAVAEIPGLKDSRLVNGQWLLTMESLHQSLPGALSLAGRHGAQLEDLSVRQVTLDDVFMQLTGHALQANT